MEGYHQNSRLATEYCAYVFRARLTVCEHPYCIGQHVGWSLEGKTVLSARAILERHGFAKGLRAANGFLFTE